MCCDLLMMQKGKPLTHKKILQTVWGPDHGEETENLRVVINQLRNKIEKDAARPRYVLTEPWLGYRFQFPIVASEPPATPQVVSFIAGDGRSRDRDSIPERSRVVPQEIPGPSPLYVSARECVRLPLSCRVRESHALPGIPRRPAKSRGRGRNRTSSPNRRGSRRWDSPPAISARRP